MRKTAAVTTALALMATPAFAQGPNETPRGQGISPAKECAGKSKKKVKGTSGHSQFSGCVRGVKGASAEHQANEQREARNQKPKQVNPARYCATQSRKKAEGQTKSPYATCVTMFVQTRNKLRQQTAS